MAETLVGGALLGNLVSLSSTRIIDAIKRTSYFKSKLKKMQKTTDSMMPLANELVKLNKELNQPKEETEEFINLLERANELVLKCENIEYMLGERYRHALKLDELNKSMFDFINVNLAVQTARDVKELSTNVKALKEGLEKGGSSGWSNRVPLEKGVVIGFEDRVRDLKAMMLKDSPNDDCSIVVVSAAGGCGKTTLVKMVCHDDQIIEKFKRKIYYATIPEHYDIKVIIQNLLERNQQREFDNDEVAIEQWGSFLAENNSELLLVLDDVRSESIVTAFKFKSPGYKILVTSRESFKQFKTYQLELLNNQEATRLFRYSSFSEDDENDEHGNNIPDDLVDELVKCCKNHPLALSVIGGSLKGKPMASWLSLQKKLSKGNKSFSSFHKSIRNCLEKSLYLFEEEHEIKQCYLDLGLFPEDQKIAATTLMDIWAHLYNHDEEGLTTIDILTTLSSRNLATLLPLRKHLPAIANYCEDESVMQHDMMRELAIHLSSKEPLELRERLIINSFGKDLDQLRQTVNARILSVSTDERFPSTWNEIQAPKVEVFVLNYMSKIHPLPLFMHNINKLKVLIITNYGYYFSEIQNFPAPVYLSGLTRIRLDHVSISSVISSILMLENLKKLSLIMCKIGSSFDKEISNSLPNLLEIDLDSCHDLVTFPPVLCNSVRLTKLSITNCHELTSISSKLGELPNLEVLRVASCTKLTALPEAITNLQKLRIIDVSNSLKLCKLPQNIGKLRNLRIINAAGCMSMQDLPKSVEDFDEIEVCCDEETSHRWRVFKNVRVEVVVVEDPIDVLHIINQPRGY